MEQTNSKKYLVFIVLSIGILLSLSSIFSTVAAQQPKATDTSGETSVRSPETYALEIYNDPNYSGTWCLDNTAQSGNIHSSCNDQTSSVALQSGWVVVFYKNANLQGAHRCVIKSDPNLSNNTFSDGSSLNNAISSYSLYHQSTCPTSSPEPDYAFEVYNNTNYQGSMCFSNGEESNNIHSNCNNQISSMMLKSGWSVWVYDGSNQVGVKRCITANDANLSNNTFEDGSIMNNRISSYSLHHQSTCPSLVDSTPPGGEVTAPEDGATIGPGSVTFSANAWDNAGGSGVGTVEFHVGYNGGWYQVGTDTTSPYQVTWQTPSGLASQELAFTIHVIDKAGNETMDPGGYHMVNFVATPTTPVLQVSPASLSFNATQGGSNPAAKSFTISNSGGGTLNWTASDNVSWLNLSRTSGTAPSTVNASININGLSAGTYTGQITVSSSGAEGSPKTVAVTLVVESGEGANDIVTAARTLIGMNYNAIRQVYCGNKGPWKSKNGVCTDVVMDAYLSGTGGTTPNYSCGGVSIWSVITQNTGGVNFENLVRADNRMHPGRYPYTTNGVASARVSENLRIYFKHNQSYLTKDQTWQVGDIAFFDFQMYDYGNPDRGKSNHVAVISVVGANGMPTKMVHANGSVTVEDDWNSVYYDVTMAHGRLSSTRIPDSESFLTSQVEIFSGNYLEVEIDQPLDVLEIVLRNTVGDYVTNDADFNLIANDNYDFIPYIAYGTYTSTTDMQIIYYYEPPAGSYYFEIIGSDDVDYTIRTKAYHGSNLISEVTYNKHIASQETQTMNLNLLVQNGDLNAYPVAPSPTDQIQTPELLSKATTTGQSMILNWQTSETTGLFSSGVITASVSSLTTPLGETLSFDVVSSNAPVLEAGHTVEQQLILAIPLQANAGLYNGAIAVRSASGKMRTIPLSLNIVSPRQIFLPLIIRH